MILLTGAHSDVERALLAHRSEAIQHRKKIEEIRRWRDCSLGYRGKLLSKYPMPAWRMKFESPVLFEAVERVTPVVVDSKPRLGVVGEDGTASDSRMAKAVTPAGEREWDDQDMQLISPALLRDVLTYGTGFAYVRVLPGDLIDEPKIVTELLSPWNVFPDPAATFEKKPDVLWTRHRVTEGDLYASFGDFAETICKEVGTKGSDMRFDEDEEFADADNEFLITTSGSTLSHTGLSHGSRGYTIAPPRYDVWLGYFHDATMIERELEHEDGTKETVDDKAYPHGRLIIMVGNRYFPELDMPNPFPHRRCPVIRMGCMNIRGSYWGKSFIEPGLDTATKMAFIDNRILDTIALTLNPVTISDDESEVDAETIYPFPGLHLKKRQGTEVSFHPPPGLPPYVAQTRADLKQELNDALGISDVSRGNVAGAINEDMSGRAVELLQEPTFTRIRPITVNFEKFVTTWGQLVVPLLMKLRSPAWWHRLLPAQVDEQTGQPLPLPWEELSEDDVAWLPDIRMTVGSSLPQNLRARFADSMLAHNAGIYGQPGSAEASAVVLKDWDHPQAEEIIARRRREESEAMVNQRIQEETPAPTPAPTPGAPPDLSVIPGGQPAAPGPAVPGMEGI